jgi:hypothetical protein
MAHVTFTNGIAYKTPHDQLLDIWHRSLANSDGIDLVTEGITSMVYWAYVLHESPLAEAVAAERATNEAASEAVEAEPVELGLDEMGADRLRWVAQLAGKQAVPIAAEETATAAVPTQGPMLETLERIPLPWPLKERIMIGHSGGSSLSLSLHDNLLLGHDGVRLLYYRAPTEGGSSGSPVFNQLWNLNGLHHAGGTEMPRLDGQLGTWAANEGIWIHRIIQETRAAGLRA